MGGNATREFLAISGCSSVPVGKDFGEGTACGHWDENFMGDELMTGFLGRSPTHLSRITVATLQDMGYQVIYDKADPFGRSDLDPSCVCATSRLHDRSVLKMKHGEVFRWGVAQAAVLADTLVRRRPSRPDSRIHRPKYKRIATLPSWMILELPTLPTRSSRCWFWWTKKSMASRCANPTTKDARSSCHEHLKNAERQKRDTRQQFIHHASCKHTNIMLQFMVPIVVIIFVQRE
jgi:Leishmanolysin